MKTESLFLLCCLLIASLFMVGIFDPFLAWLIFFGVSTVYATINICKSYYDRKEIKATPVIRSTRGESYEIVETPDD